MLMANEYSPRGKAKARRRAKTVMLAAKLAARFRTWEIASDRDILLAIGMVEGPCILHAGGFDSVGYEQQRNQRRAMLQKLRKAKLIRWRPSHRKWQYVGQ
jgi:hypothetical protein